MIEKSPTQSKKWLGFMVAELTWSVFLLVLATNEGVATPLLVAIVAKGFVEVGYILGQSALDKYVRLARIAAGATHAVGSIRRGNAVDRDMPVVSSGNAE